MIILDADFVKWYTSGAIELTEQEIEKLINLRDKDLEIVFEENLNELWWEITFEAAREAIYELVK